MYSLFFPNLNYTAQTTFDKLKDAILVAQNRGIECTIRDQSGTDVAKIGALRNVFIMYAGLLESEA